MDSRKRSLLLALDAFVRRRPGLEYGNYGDEATYRAEARRIANDLRRYRELERLMLYADDITAERIVDASRTAFSGRLTITEHSAADHPTPHFGLNYCTGQYRPTEYRKAACAVLAAALSIS